MFDELCCLMCAENACMIVEELERELDISYRDFCADYVEEFLNYEKNNN